MAIINGDDPSSDPFGEAVLVLLLVLGVIAFLYYICVQPDPNFSPTKDTKVVFVSYKKDSLEEVPQKYSLRIIVSRESFPEESDDVKV